MDFPEISTTTFFGRQKDKAVVPENPYVSDISDLESDEEEYCPDSDILA